MVSLYFVARGEVQHCRIAAKGHRVHPASFPLRDWLYTLLKLKCSWFTMLCEFQVYSKVMCVCVCTLMCSLSHVHSPWDPVGPTKFLICGISQARILEWAAISSSRESSQPRGWTQVSCIPHIARWVLYHWCHLGSPLADFQIPFHYYIIKW